MDNSRIKIKEVVHVPNLHANSEFMLKALTLKGWLCQSNYQLFEIFYLSQLNKEFDRCETFALDAKLPEEWVPSFAIISFFLISSMMDES